MFPFLFLSSLSSIPTLARKEYQKSKAKRRVQEEKQKKQLQIKSAIRIQSLIRGFLARKKYKQSKKPFQQQQLKAKGGDTLYAARKPSKEGGEEKLQPTTKTGEKKDKAGLIKQNPSLLQSSTDLKGKQVASKLKLAPSDMNTRAALLIQKVFRGHKERERFYRKYPLFPVDNLEVDIPDTPPARNPLLFVLEEVERLDLASN